MIEVDRIQDEQDLERLLSDPYPEDVEMARRLQGDLLVLGAGGKMGPTLVERIVRAIQQAGSPSKVYAASRFSDPLQREKLEAEGAKTLAADLMEEAQLSALPRCPYVIYMVGMKFGSTGQEERTWAVNAYLPGRVAEHFRDARIVAFSTGNVYPLVPVDSGGSREEDRPGPVGEYAQSCLGRERVLQYFSLRHSTPMCILRLNYAVEARYGVLLDIAVRVYAGEPIPLEMGYVNVIWQGDANSVCFRSFDLCRSPAEILNLTGPETLSVRELAETFGERLGRRPVFEGREGPTALLNNASRCHARFGPPRVPVSQVIDLVARWVSIGGPTLAKPTKFEIKDGQF